RLGGRRGRGALAGAVPAPAQRHPARPPGAPAAAQPARARHRRRRDPRLQQDRPRRPDARLRHRHRGGQRRPARHPGDHGAPRPAGPRPELGGRVRRARRAHRPDLAVGRPQLRPARPPPRARPHPDRPEAPLTETPAVQALNDEPEWFKTAIFYEVLVRSFYDSDNDGCGDFAGLTAKLDYLQWLGVDCLWVPPFFTSPLRDGGYDVADYTGVLPEVGTIEDFQTFLDAAHSRGIRVIIDFVMNHTSDQHPWFQASRTDPDGP